MFSYDEQYKQAEPAWHRISLSTSRRPMAAKRPDCKPLNRQNQTLASLASVKDVGSRGGFKCKVRGAPSVHVIKKKTLESLTCYRSGTFQVPTGIKPTGRPSLIFIPSIRWQMVSNIIKVLSELCLSLRKHGHGNGKFPKMEILMRNHRTKWVLFHIDLVMDDPFQLYRIHFKFHSRDR